MSLPSLSVSASASPPIQHHSRSGSEQSAPQSAFGAVMQSLSEKGSRSKGSGSVENGSEAAAAIPFSQGSDASAAPSTDAQAVGLAAVLTHPPSAFIASAASASPGGGAAKPIQSLKASDRSPVGSDSRAFSSAAAAMRLHVSRSVSHVGVFSPSQAMEIRQGGQISESGRQEAESPGAGFPDDTAGNAPRRVEAVIWPNLLSSSDGANIPGANSLAPTTDRAPASFAEMTPPLAGSAGLVPARGATSEGGAGTTPSINGVSFPLIPDVVAETTASLEQPQLTPKSSAAAPTGAAPSAKSNAAGELDGQLIRASDRGQAGSDWRAFSSAAAAMRLHVSRSVSHFGASSPAQLMGISSSDGANVSAANSLAPTTDRAPASVAEMTPALPDGAGQVTAGSATGEGAAGTMVSMGGVPLPLIPDVIAEATASLEQSQVTPKSNAAAPAGAAPGAKASAARELDVQLTPAELGSVTVKLRLSGGTLSVVIEASKPSTLSAIERERDTLLSRITSADHQVSSLVLRTSDSTTSMHEDGDAYDPVAANGSNAQGQTDQRSQWSEAGARKKDPGPERRAPSNTAGYLLV